MWRLAINHLKSGCGIKANNNDSVYTTPIGQLVYTMYLVMYPLYQQIAIACFHFVAIFQQDVVCEPSNKKIINCLIFPGI